MTERSARPNTRKPKPSELAGPMRANNQGHGHSKADNEKQSHAKRSSGLHPNNRHQGRYDFTALYTVTPELKAHITQNSRGEATINFSNAESVLCLNKALLASFYGIKYWGLPGGYLCLPIPGRADYIHCLAELIEVGLERKSRRILDIGTSANLIYPIIGPHEYGWSFVASELDKTAFECASVISDLNKVTKRKVTVVHQKDRKRYFEGVVGEADYFDACMCNPPFHASEKEAREGSQRKWRNLKKQASVESELNFGGNANELWCEGGERSFIAGMISESINFQSQVGWFTCLVSKQENLKPLRKLLAKSAVHAVRVVNMAQGQKQSRILAWRFCSEGDEAE